MAAKRNAPIARKTPKTADDLGIGERRYRTFRLITDRMSRNSPWNTSNLNTWSGFAEPAALGAESKAE